MDRFSGRRLVTALITAVLFTACNATATTAPATPGPATPAAATPAPATAVPPTVAPATPVPATPVPATAVPVTPEPATPVPATPTPVVNITPVPEGSVTLSLLVDNTQASVATANSVANAYMALPENAGKVTILIETRPQGNDGDNVVKTRLATNDMADIFWYNSGSLLQALHPDQTLVDLSDQPFMANLADSFKQTVQAGTGIYGVPWQTAMGGGILYNKKVFAANGLSVPKTWDDFAANNDKLVAAGIAPVGQSYGPGSTWTSQLFVLADYCNVQAAEPDFAAKYTANQEKYATNPAALAGFQHLEQGFKTGWYQKDFGSAQFADMLNALAAGTIAQYPMLTFALGTIATDHPDQINDIGYFGQPGTDASKNCSTIWEPAASYIPKSSQHIPDAIKFEAFLASVAGVDAITAAVPPTGPYVVTGAKLPDSVLPAVKDVQAYLDNNAAAPALEFLSPVKGPNLETITVAVGSGITSAADGAAQYDKDVEAAAQQLGLPGW